MTAGSARPRHWQTFPIVLIAVAVLVPAVLYGTTGRQGGIHEPAGESLRVHAGATAAVAEGQVLTVTPYEGGSVFVADVRLASVGWRDARKTYVDGRVGDVPPLDEGDVLTVASYREPGIGDTYDLFLNWIGDTSVGAEWVAWFAFSEDGAPVAGMPERLVDEARALLGDDESLTRAGVAALTEYVQEQVAVVEARNSRSPSPTGTPRTDRLESRLQQHRGR